jgi:hypothetical protein
MSPWPITMSGASSFGVASAKVDDALMDLQEHYGLTDLEMLKILNSRAREDYRQEWRP